VLFFYSYLWYSLRIAPLPRGAFLLFHRLSIKKPTKRGKEKSPSDGHCQCEKEMEDLFQARQQFLKENHQVTRLPNDQASFYFLERLTAIFIVLWRNSMFCSVPDTL
jgi:hypothetical protein